MKTAIVAFFSRLSFRQKVVGAVALVVVVFSLFKALSGGASPATIAVTRGPIAETVSVTGQLEPIQSVELSFQSGGRITQVPARVGDIVKPGQLLASLDNSELGAQLRDAEANVLTQKSRLDNISAGGRPEEIAIKEAELLSAQQSLQDATDNAYDVLFEAFGQADDALRIEMYPIFNAVGDEDYPEYELTFDCSCYTEEVTAIENRARAEEGMLSWRARLDTLATGATADEFKVAIDEAQVHLQRAREAVNATSRLFEDASFAVGLETDTLTDYRERLNRARANVVAATTSVNSQEQLITTSSIAVSKAQSSLQLTRTGSTQQEIDAQRAQLLSAQAQADRIRSLIGKGIIRSPVAGTVTKVDAKVGQSASPNEVLISVVSVSNLEMTANVPEVDIGKVSVGNRIDFTVDALLGETFTASVSYIDPAETVIDGVVNYRIKAAVPPGNDRLKSGLTVNMDIRTRFIEDTLTLPQFAVIQNDDGTFVEKISGNERVRTPVTLGIRSSDGLIEITSGLSEGDVVANIGLKQ